MNRNRKRIGAPGYWIVPGAIIGAAMWALLFWWAV